MLYIFNLSMLLVFFVVCTTAKASIDNNSGFYLTIPNELDFSLAIPLKPKVNSPITYMYGQKTLQLTAAHPNNTKLLWYTVKIGGVGSVNAPVPTTHKVGSQKYWVSQVNEFGTESERTTVVVIVKKAKQEISFDPIAIKDFEKTKSFYLQASSTSKLPITYKIVGKSKVATVDATGFVVINEPGVVQILAKQEGNKNYNCAKGALQTLLVESNDASLLEITIDNIAYTKPTFTNTIRIYSNEKSIETKINNIVIPKGATSNAIVAQPMIMQNYGDYFYKILVTSQSGKVKKHYSFKIERRASTEVFVSFNSKKELVINNLRASNVGYRFIGYEWYVNNVKNETVYFRSNADIKKEVISMDNTYSIVFIQYNGERLKTTNFEIKQSELTKPKGILALRFNDLIGDVFPSFLKN